jgi:uncharacterized protein
MGALRVKQMFTLTSSRIAGIILLGFGLYAPATRVAAFEAADGAQVEKAPLKTYATLNPGLEGFSLGDSATAIEALKVAAAGGELLAQWKLAERYKRGDGVPRDDLKAYEYFSEIVKSYDEDSPNRLEAAIMSSAVVGLGVYSLHGIENSEVVADPQLALRLFQFAATHFGDANAQYNLGQMHLDGVGVGKDELEALRWLCLAAQKGQVQAKARLDALRPQVAHLGTGCGGRFQ